MSISKWWRLPHENLILGSLLLKPMRLRLTVVTSKEDRHIWRQRFSLIRITEEPQSLCWVDTVNMWHQGHGGLEGGKERMLGLEDFTYTSVLLQYRSGGTPVGLVWGSTYQKLPWVLKFKSTFLFRVSRLPSH